MLPHAILHCDWSIHEYWDWSPGLRFGLCEVGQNFFSIKLSYVSGNNWTFGPKKISPTLLRLTWVTLVIWINRFGRDLQNIPYYLWGILQKLGRPNFLFWIFCMKRVEYYQIYPLKPFSPLGGSKWHQYVKSYFS